MQPNPKRKFDLLDTNVLECPICSEDLTPPVYQCPSGHTACAACWEKIGSAKCPSCQKPIGNNRNIAVEKILESLRVSCKNALYGCNEMLRYTEKARHETTRCEYQPFNCLFNGCKFEGSTRSLPLHFKEEHQVQTVDGPRGSYTLETEGCNIREGDKWKRNFLLVPKSAHGLGNCEFQGQLNISNHTGKHNQIGKCVKAERD